MTTSDTPSSPPPHQLRIKVRGQFRDLTADQRRLLLDEAAEHDPFSATFTEEGFWSYDLPSRPSFIFWFTGAGTTSQEVAAATRRAEAAVQSRLVERGLQFTLTTTHVVDLTDAPRGKRGRRYELSSLSSPDASGGGVRARGQ